MLVSSVGAIDHVSYSMTEFNRAVMNNELDEEVFASRTYVEGDSDDSWSSTEDEASPPLFSSEEA